MTTLFIALQCCRCSTMQVKQQRKKSGSKWVCAVCNQRQAVRRIHARGPLARDLRKFVQDFNMARAGITSDGPDPVFPLSDGSGALSDDEGARGGGVSSSCGSPSSSAKKRTDWSEYLDPADDEEDQDGFVEEGVAVAVAVATELPWAKKCRTESSNRKSRLGRKPAVPKREKLTSGGDRDKADRDAGSGSRIQEGKAKGGSSTKWSEYLEEEEEGDAKESHRPGRGGRRLLVPDYFHPEGSSQEIAVEEEEIHPDFM